MHRWLLKSCSAIVSAGLALQPLAMSAPRAAEFDRSLMSGALGQPDPNSDVAPHYSDPAFDPRLPNEELIELVRHRVKYVFVLFQENRSFDHYFGTFRGANGLFSDGRTPRVPTSNTQALIDTDGTVRTIQPFRIGPDQNAADLDDVDHGHARMAAKMHVTNGVAAMDRFALNEQAKYFAGSPINPATAPATVPLRSKQFGELAMAYVDCDTIPFLWNYANRFTLFDNVFQTTIGPSTPNAIAMIAGQSGETQWVKHPETTSASTYGSIAVPITNDPIPGLPAATAQYSGIPSQPTNIEATINTGANGGTPQRKNEFGGATNVAPNLTFAGLPLTLAGRTLADVASHDANPGLDLPDVRQDIPYITGRGHSPRGWGWYQNGYTAEAGLPDANGINTVPHASYIGHHNGPQYFGYVTNNPEQSSRLHGLGNFFGDIREAALPQTGGVFYVRGGYDNIMGMRPDTSHAVSAADADYISGNFLGDDDHPAYSDSQISESLIANEVNAIAGSKYWGESAIVITYDESEGDYDHVPPRILSYDPAGLPLSRGPRIPLIVISPYARAHAVAHEEGDHNSVIRLVNSLFGLPSLATLPDEMAARLAGAQGAGFQTGPAGFTQTFLSSHDAPGMPTGALLSAFDPGRLIGYRSPLPTSYATIPAAAIAALPHYGGQGCAALNLTTEDRVQGLANAVPSDFSARPSQTPN